MIRGYSPIGYFCRDYFGASNLIPGAGAVADPLPIVAPSITDADCFRSLVSTLEGSGLFERVQLGGPDVRAVRDSAVWLRPWRAAERRDSDCIVRIRTVRYRLVAYALADTFSDDPASIVVADMAAGLADLIDRNPPPGCLAGETRIIDGEYPDAGAKSSAVAAPRWPLVAFAMIGQFAYEITAGQRGIGALAG